MRRGGCGFVRWWVHEVVYPDELVGWVVVWAGGGGSHTVCARGDGGGDVGGGDRPCKGAARPVMLHLFRPGRPTRPPLPRGPCLGCQAEPCACSMWRRQRRRRRPSAGRGDQQEAEWPRAGVSVPRAGHEPHRPAIRVAVACPARPARGEVGHATLSRT